MYKPNAERVFEEVEKMYLYMRSDSEIMKLSTTLSLHSTRFASLYEIKLDREKGQEGYWLYNIKIKKGWSVIRLYNLDFESMSSRTLKLEIKIRMRY